MYLRVYPHGDFCSVAIVNGHSCGHLLTTRRDVLRLISCNGCIKLRDGLAVAKACRTQVDYLHRHLVDHLQVCVECVEARLAKSMIEMTSHQHFLLLLELRSLHLALTAHVVSLG
jgi:hypothetical protein